MGVSGKWEACGWSVARLNLDSNEGPLFGRHGTLQADLDVQRTIKAAVLIAFLSLLRRVTGPTTAHVDNNGIMDGLSRGEVECVESKAKTADLWTSSWEKLNRIHQEVKECAVRHVKGQRNSGGEEEDDAS